MSQTTVLKKITQWDYHRYGMTLVLVIFALVVYYDTLESMVKIWIRSETYTHCFLIFPISGYLIWRKKDILIQIPPTFSLLGVISLMGFISVWFLAKIVEVAYFEQLSLIGIIVSIVWSLLGNRITLEILFPLVFLFFSVPVGEFLIPSLINFTASFAEFCIRLVGIPIYREGSNFSLPSGNWSVVEACSGLRYLIASITLGTLFAYLNYNSYLYRAVFIVASIVTPVIANGLRAFMIVMIGHFSGMTLAVGVDHIIYGWVFFGLVMALLFWIGSFWTEIEEEPNIVLSDQPILTGQAPLFKTAQFAVLGVLLAAAPYLVHHSRIDDQQALERSALSALPDEIGNWKSSNEKIAWEPSYSGYANKVENTYSDGRSRIKLLIYSYALAENRGELISSMNTLVPPEHGDANVVSSNKVKLDLADRSLSLEESEIKTKHNTGYLVWSWYWISNNETANQYIGKLLEAKQKVLNENSKEAAIFLVLESAGEGGLPTKQETLKNFLTEARSALLSELQK